MRSRWNIVIVFVYMGIAFGVLSYMAFNMIGPCRPFAGCLSLNVEFKNASGLLHSNDLRVAGVKAGSVTTIKNQGDMAVVSIQVQPDYLPVYRDAHAIVRPKNLLGETYVEIDRGSAKAGEYREGDTIPLKNTITPVQVDEVLNALDPDTRTKLQIVINSLGEATAGRGQDLNLSAGDLKRISADLAVTGTSLNQQKDNIDALLVQLDLIQQTAADDHQQLAQTLQDWNTVSITMQKKATTLASAIDHLAHVLGALDQGLSPNATALNGAVAQLPTAITDAAYNTPGSQIPGVPNPNGGFLGISSSIQELFTTKPANCPTCGYSLQDGVALFPRLAQSQLGINTCDNHIYANGYHNVPGVTEPANCINPVDANGNSTDPTLSGEVFGNFNPTTGAAGNRHLWRVMGMIDLGQASCGLLNPTTAPLSSCTAGPNNGLGPYGPSSSSTGPASNSSGTASGGGFWQNLLSGLMGGGGA